jgi:localization factor PodJL
MDAEAGDATPKARTSLFKRVKSLFLAASVIAIVIGGVQIASNFVDFGGPNDKVAQVNDLVPEKTAAKAPADEIEAPATVAAATEPAPVPPTAAVQEAPRPSSSPTGLPSVALVQPGANVPSPPLWSAPGANLPGFATGSISRPAAAVPTAPQIPVALPAARNGDQLPAAIGGMRLRSAATATRARFARTRFVHGQGPTFDGLAIEIGDRFLRIGFISHGDKSEAARFAGEFVLHESDFGDRARLREEVLEIGFGGVEGKISDV